MNRVAAGLLGTAAVVTTAAGTGEELRLLTGVDTASSASEPGTKQSPIAVVGAGGKWVVTKHKWALETGLGCTYRMYQEVGDRYA